MIGKVPHSLLDAHVLDRTGASDDRVIQGPAVGEDTGAIRLDEGILVVSTDPISLAVERIGTLGVAIACNDIAASGASPSWLTVSVFLSDDSPAQLEAIATQLDAAASEHGVAIVSGHTEYATDLERPMLGLTAFGLTDRYVPTGGARPGDALLMTKSAAVEGTAILAADFGDELEVDASTVEAGRTYFDRLSVMPEASLLGEVATAMHDPTEGGLLTGCVELAVASGSALEIDPEAIPVTEVTQRLCDAAGVDPRRIFSSGVLLATIPQSALERARAALAEAGIEATVIGTVRSTESPSVTVGETVIDAPIEDDLYALWA